MNIDKDVSSAHLAAAGWHLDDFAHSNPFESHVFYVRDFRTDHLQLFTVRQADFASLDLPQEIPTLALAGALAELMLRVHAGTLTDEEESHLGVLLAGYTKRTKAYRQWLTQADAQERLHMLLCIGSDYAQNCFVRPAIVRSPQTVLSAEDVLRWTAPQP